MIIINKNNILCKSQFKVNNVLMVVLLDCNLEISNYNDMCHGNFKLIIVVVWV